MHKVKLVVTPAVVLVAVSLAAQAAWADPTKKAQQQPAPAQANSDDVPPPDQLRLKVFRLRHVDPQVLAKIAGKLLLPAAMPNAPKGGGPAGGMPGGLAFGFPGQPGLGGAGFAGFGGVGFAGFMGGGLTGMPGAGMGFFPDKRTRTLLVRGIPEGLQIVGDLVSLLDLPPGNARPKVKDLAAFTLQNTTPETVADALHKLHMQVSAAVVPDTRLLIVRGDEEAITEVREVVEALDVPAK
jgi:type II secretory pathway component GspD/PulD (secretin)